MILYLTKPPIYDDRETAERVASAGVSVGLVWTAFGGEVQFVEATAMVGKGDLHLTGQLGDVIKESAQIALTWVIISTFFNCTCNIMDLSKYLICLLKILLLKMRMTFWVPTNSLIFNRKILVPIMPI